MTITTYLLSKLDFSAPKRWLAGKSGAPLAQSPWHTKHEPAQLGNAMFSIAPPADSASTRARKLPASKPLRVVRVVEQGQARHHVGRMVISGSMADVCAELDRLAAFEPA